MPQYHLTERELERVQQLRELDAEAIEILDRHIDLLLAIQHATDTAPSRPVLRIVALRS